MGYVFRFISSIILLIIGTLLTILNSKLKLDNIFNQTRLVIGIITTIVALIGLLGVVLK